MEIAEGVDIGIVHQSMTRTRMLLAGDDMKKVTPDGKLMTTMNHGNTGTSVLGMMTARPTGDGAVDMKQPGRLLSQHKARRMSWKLQGQSYSGMHGWKLRPPSKSRIFRQAPRSSQSRNSCDHQSLR